MRLGLLVWFAVIAVASGSLVFGAAPTAHGWLWHGVLVVATIGFLVVFVRFTAATAAAGRRACVVLV